MKKTKVVLILLAFCSLFAFTGNVFAQCSGTTQAECEAKEEDGYKCKWDINKKGGARCSKSKELTDKAIEEANKTYTSCTEIKDYNTCTASKIGGYSCIWRQGYCFDNKVPKQDENTSNQVAGNKTQATQKYSSATTKTTKKTKPGTEYQNDDAIVGENFCSEPEAIKGLKAVGYLLFIAKILVPLIIIGMGTYDVYQSIVDPDKIMSKSVKGLLIRIAIGVAVFFIPRIVYTVLNIAQDMGVASEKSANCRKALLDPWDLGTDIGEQRTYSTDGNLTDRGYPDSKSGQ